MQAQRIDALVNKFNIPDSDRTVIEYFHRYKKQLDEATTQIENELNKLGVGYKTDDVLKTFDQTLTNRLIAEADAKGFAVKTVDGWTLTPKGGGESIYEYAIDVYEKLTVKGTDHFFEAHHSIQKFWGELRINSKLKTDYPESITKELYNEKIPPSINLRDRRSASPHNRITSRQRARASTAGERNYMQERELMIEDLRIADVPEAKINELIKKNDLFFKSIYDEVKSSLQMNSKLTEQIINNELFSIFGTHFN